MCMHVHADLEDAEGLVVRAQLIHESPPLGQMERSNQMVVARQGLCELRAVNVNADGLEGGGEIAHLDGGGRGAGSVPAEDPQHLITIVVPCTLYPRHPITIVVTAAVVPCILAAQTTMTPHAIGL